MTSALGKRPRPDDGDGASHDHSLSQTLAAISFEDRKRLRAERFGIPYSVPSNGDAVPQSSQSICRLASANATAVSNLSNAGPPTPFSPTDGMARMTLQLPVHGVVVPMPSAPNQSYATSSESASSIQRSSSSAANGALTVWLDSVKGLHGASSAAAAVSASLLTVTSDGRAAPLGLVGGAGGYRASSSGLSSSASACPGAPEASGHAIIGTSSHITTASATGAGGEQWDALPQRARTRRSGHAHGGHLVNPSAASTGGFASSRGRAASSSSAGDDEVMSEASPAAAHVASATNAGIDFR